MTATPYQDAYYARLAGKDAPAAQPTMALPNQAKLARAVAEGVHRRYCGDTCEASPVTCEGGLELRAASFAAAAVLALFQPTAQPTVEAVARVVHPHVQRGPRHEYLDLDRCVPMMTNTGASCSSYTRLVASDVLALLPGRPESVVKAEAWDEGYAQGVADYRMGRWFPTDKGAEARPDRRAITSNPYRADRIEAGR